MIPTVYSRIRVKCREISLEAIICWGQYEELALRKCLKSENDPEYVRHH